jgi:hypothetical protein
MHLQQVAAGYNCNEIFKKRVNQIPERSKKKKKI